MLCVELAPEKHFALELIDRDIKAIEEKKLKYPILSARRKLHVAMNRLRQIILESPSMADYEFYFDDPTEEPFTPREAMDMAGSVVSLPLRKSNSVMLLCATMQVLQILFCCEATIKAMRER